MGILRSLNVLFARFAAATDGGVAPLLALTALPLMASVGAAIDYGRGSSAKAAMQSALDSTALAMVRSIENGATPPDAQTTFKGLFTRSNVSGITVTSTTTQTGTGQMVSLSARGTLPTAFMQIIGASQLTIAAKSSAAVEQDLNGCVMALSSSASPAISLGGSTSVSLSACALYSNSNAATAVSIGGSAFLAADMIGAVGGISASSSNVSLANGMFPHIGAVKDPYTDLSVPSYSGCTQTNLKVKVDTTIDPGVYCNGITINAGATLTLNPGIYTIDRGSLSINGGGAITGTGVTLIFTSSTGANWATANINGNASVNLTAPASGPTAGIVIFADRNAPKGTSIDMEGGSTQSLGGALYAPTGAVTYAGGAATSSSCTQIIGDTVTFTGNSGVAINCSSYKTKDFGSERIRLTS
jgi:Flp pilus assembly protein TadG